MTIKIDKSKDGMGEQVFKASFDRWEGEWESDERVAIESLMGKIVNEYRMHKEASKSDRETLTTISRMFQPQG
jgi:hypothetical protein